MAAACGAEKPVFAGVLGATVWLCQPHSKAATRAATARSITSGGGEFEVSSRTMPCPFAFP